MGIPDVVMNWIDGSRCAAEGGETFEKCSPADGRKLCSVARSKGPDIAAAVVAAQKAQPAWATTTPVHRGDVLRDVGAREGVDTARDAQEHARADEPRERGGGHALSVQCPSPDEARLLEQLDGAFCLSGHDRKRR